MANTFKFGNGEWAVGKETALAYNDENSNFKPLAFTFDRASTATVVNKQGLIETVGIDEPRIDFLNNTKGHLLLEPKRRNHIPYSEDFSIAQWVTLSGASKEYNVAISPDGTQNASRFSFDGTFNSRVEYSFVSGLTNGTTYTISVYLKSESGNIEDVKIGHDGWGLKSVTVTDEWQRFTQTITSNSINAYPRVRLDTEGSVLVWGYQLEDNGEGGDAEYATSYIPTQGSAVTRSAEICKQDLSQVVSSNTHTIYWEGIVKSHSGDDGFAFTFSESDSNINTAILFYRLANGKIGFYGTLNQSPIFSAPLSESTVSYMDTVAKYALAIENNRLSIYRNGTKIISSTATQTIPSNLKWIQLNRWNNVSALNTSTYKDLRYYNTALSDSELQALTS